MIGFVSDSRVINRAYLLIFQPTFEVSTAKLGVTLTQLGLPVCAVAAGLASSATIRSSQSRESSRLTNGSPAESTSE